MLTFYSWTLTGILVCLCSCAVPFKPCTGGGQAARDGATQPFRGTKQCYQVVDRDGKKVNHGPYWERFADDKIAVKGEYEMGKKTGRWIEYDESGKKISDKYFAAGKEIPSP